MNLGFLAFLLALHHDSRGDAGMDSAIEFERSGRGEGTNGLRAVAVDLHVLDLRCARLSGRVRRTLLPGSIGDDVRRQRVVNQRETLPFLDRDGCLDKLRVVHMDSIPCRTGSGVGSATGDQKKGDDTPQYQ